MAFFSVDELEPKMVTAADIKTSGGIVLVRRNTVLTEAIIEKLRRLGIEQEVEILDESIVKKEPEVVEPQLEKAVPPGYKTDKGYVIAERVVNKEFAYPGNLIINSDIENSKIRTSGSIIVTGNVINSNLISIAGGIRVEGDIKGEDRKYQLICEKNLIIKSAYDYVLVANGNLELEKEMRNCSVRVGNSLSGQSATVTRSEILAGDKIVLFVAGDEAGTNTVLHISYYTVKKLFQRLMTIETEMKDYEKEISTLTKSLEVIKLLGDKIMALPEEKQLQLKEQNKLYMKYSKALDDLLKEKTRILHALKILKESDEPVVRILGFAFPGTIIQLDKVKLELYEVMRNVGFYKKGIVRIKNFDSI